MHGTAPIPALTAALYLVCPAIISLFLSTIIGTLKPNSWIDWSTALTALSFFLGLVR